MCVRAEGVVSELHRTAYSRNLIDKIKGKMVKRLFFRQGNMGIRGDMDTGAKTVLTLVAVWRGLQWYTPDKMIADAHRRSPAKQSDGFGFGFYYVS